LRSLMMPRRFRKTQTQDAYANLSNRLEKHMDMLFKITHSSNFNTSIQALMLIQQLASTKTIAVERFYRTLYESLLDPRLITSSKHALYLNLLFRALKADLNIKRVKAFAKRLVQIITFHQPPFICGVLYLLRELEVTFPGLTSMITDPEESDELEEEIFRDVPDEDEAKSEEQKLRENLIHPDRQPKPSVSHKTYDGRKRDPEHSNAEKSCLWELVSTARTNFVGAKLTYFLVTFYLPFSSFRCDVCRSPRFFKGDAS
jgi:ribosome biogenesis protein MAK21